MKNDVMESMNASIVPDDLYDTLNAISISEDLLDQMNTTVYLLVSF